MGSLRRDLAMKTPALLASLLVVAVSAQDTNYCPDGWYLYDRHGLVECFYIGNEWVTKESADVICAAHGGAWVAEMDHPGINYWLKSLLIDHEEGANQGNQYWLGGTTSERHGSHHPGTWWWPHFNRTIEWTDWADNEPNNMDRNENCMTFYEYRDPIFPIFRDFYWNDMDCDGIARYLCAFHPET